jgi:hypothetical protein
MLKKTMVATALGLLVAANHDGPEAAQVKRPQTYQQIQYLHVTLQYRHHCILSSRVS